MRRRHVVHAVLLGPILLAGCGRMSGMGPTGVALPPPVVKAVPLTGHAVTVRWQADTATAAFTDEDALPASIGARASLLTSAIEAATNCTVVEIADPETVVTLEVRLDCSIHPLVTL